MLESILFKDVELVLPEGVRQGDLLVENGKISQIDWHIQADVEKVVAEKGLTLMPGLIDTHVHFREPGAEWKEDLYSGSRAAASGGVTSFFDMPNNQPSATSIETITHKKALAAQKSCVNYNFFIGGTQDNIAACHDVENVPGIKLFVGSSTGDLLVCEPDILEAFFAHGHRAIVVHSEDEAMVQENQERYKGSTNVADHARIRSVEAAVKSTQALLALSKKYQRRLHIAHLTTEEEIGLIQEVKKRAPVTTEVCIQHLLLTAPSCYDSLGTFAQINPPLREARHAKALWKAVKSGVISSIVTDHAPHLITEKQNPFGKAPSGMPGVETILPLLLTQAANGVCSLTDIVNWTAYQPTQLYTIPNKGALKVGYDADLVLVDRHKRWVVNNKNMVSKCAWSAFDGWDMIGKSIASFVHGQMAYREGQFFEDVRGKEIKIL